MNSNTVSFGAIAPFDLSVRYVEIDSMSPLNVYDSHIHDECEIYINISGDVSFAVENSIYPIVSGSVILTKPHEYHHCLYHTNKLHRHYWILFSATGNERLFDLFFNRTGGSGNLLLPDGKQREEMFALCRELLDCRKSELEKYALFFRLICILQNATAINAPEHTNDCLVNAIKYIEENLPFALRVEAIAKHCFVSVNTLETRFRQTLHVTPHEYIQKKRLTLAVKLLSEGKSVTEAAMQSGFPDASNFIACFKKAFGITPLKYKNTHR